jgi:hypothetical protein
MYTTVTMFMIVDDHVYIRSAVKWSSQILNTFRLSPNLIIISLSQWSTIGFWIQRSVNLHKFELNVLPSPPIIYHLRRARALLPCNRTRKCQIGDLKFLFPSASWAFSPNARSTNWDLRAVLIAADYNSAAQRQRLRWWKIALVSQLSHAAREIERRKGGTAICCHSTRRAYSRGGGRGLIAKLVKLKHRLCVFVLNGSVRLTNRAWIH